MTGEKSLGLAWLGLGLGCTVDRTGQDPDFNWEVKKTRSCSACCSNPELPKYRSLPVDVLLRNYTGFQKK